MMAGLACCGNGNMKAIRGVMVTGSIVLLAMAVTALVDFLGLRASGVADEMLYAGSWMWYKPSQHSSCSGVDGISVLMILLSAVIVLPEHSLPGKSIPFPRTSSSGSVSCRPVCSDSSFPSTCSPCSCSMRWLLIPMYLLIGVWGTGRKEYSAMKLTLMLMGGSAFLMLGLLGIYWHSAPEGGQLTWNILEISHNNSIDAGWQNHLFCFTFVGFGVLGAMFPFHTWSPDGHACAPTAVSMLHAGVLMKLGGYGCFRIAIFLLPSAAQGTGMDIHRPHRYQHCLRSLLGMCADRPQIYQRVFVGVALWHGALRNPDA